MSVDFLGGGNSNIFFMFTPKIGEMMVFDEHIFQMGWFNHQLAKLLDLFLLVDFSLTYFYRIDQHKSLVFVWFWHFWMIFVVPTKNRTLSHKMLRVWCHMVTDGGRVFHRVIPYLSQILLFLNEILTSVNLHFPGWHAGKRYAFKYFLFTIEDSTSHMECPLTILGQVCEPIWEV